MKKHVIRYLFLGLILLTFRNAFAQSSAALDSIRDLLSKNPTDSTRSFLLIQLSLEYKEINRQKAFESGNEAVALAQKCGYKKGEGKAHNNIGDLYWYAGDYSS